MPSARQKHGAWAESQAADFLRRRGIHIIARHVTNRYGEIDILAKDGDVLVAVEVKARRNNKYGPAITAVTDIKIERLTSALDDILSKSYWPEERVRLDVITVEPEKIEHLMGVG